MDLLCGPWGGALCSPQRLLDYLGSISNGYAPFQINYFIHKADETDTSFQPHNPLVSEDMSRLPGILNSFSFQLPLRQDVPLHPRQVRPRVHVQLRQRLL